MFDDFFGSPIVLKALDEIIDLQNQVLLFATYGEFASLDQQKENLEVLRSLHAKQKNMCFRCSLSDDDLAKELMWEVVKHFEKFGHVINPEDPLAVFDEVTETLDQIEYEIAFCEMNGHFPGEDPDEQPGGETPPFMF